MTYTELVVMIQEFCAYTEANFIARIPQFVKNAEERIQRSVYLPAFRKIATAVTTLNSKYVACPSDYLFSYSLSLTNGSSTTPLLFKEPDWVREAYPGTGTGVPIYYSQFDKNTFALGPTPDAAYALELTYNFVPQSIVDCDISWLGSNAQNALLYASLIEAGIYMRQDQDLLQDYQMHYQEALDQLDVFGGLRARKDDFKERDKRKGADV